MNRRAFNSSESNRQITSHTEKETFIKKPSVSVIIPTYNEIDNIGHVIDRCLSALTNFETEIIVVDDNSPDKTADVVYEIYKDCPNVNVIHRTEDRGLAQAVTEGFQRVNNDYVAVIDADLQHPPERLPNLFNALDTGSDIAIGSRHITGGRIENWARWRKLISWGAAQLARIALPKARNLSDPMSGFFAVRREVVENVTLDAKGYKILLEVLAKGQYDQEKVTEIPYIFEERKYGESKLTKNEYIKFMEHLLLLWMFSHEHYKVIHPQPDRVSKKRDVLFHRFYKTIDRNRIIRAIKFSMIGGVGAIVNMVIFYAGNIYTNSHYFLVGIIAFIVALNWNFIGNWFITFEQPEGELFPRYIRFYYVSIMGLIVYCMILAITIDGLRQPLLLGNMVAIVAGAMFNFIGSEKFVFVVQSNFADSESTEDFNR